MEEVGEVAEGGGGGIKVEDWVGAAATDDEDGSDGGDEDESGKKEAEGKRCEMAPFLEQPVTSAPFPPPRLTRGQRDSCEWHHSRWPSH